MSTAPTGLFKKLLTIQQKVNGLSKDRDTKSNQNPNGYKYVTGSKVLDHIKPLMNDLGLILKQEVLSIDNDRQDYNTKYGSKSEILSKVMMRFTWVDTDTGEKDENLFGANGQNDWEKGLGSALTYAERYFLLKYFHIETDADDVDNSDRETTPPLSHADKLNGCNTLSELQQAWDSIPKKDKPELLHLKNQVKEKLTPDTQTA